MVNVFFHQKCVYLCRRKTKSSLSLRLLNTVFYSKNRAKILTIKQLHAGVAKLVDVPDLGSGAVRHGGSSPSTRTFFGYWRVDIR